MCIQAEAKPLEDLFDISEDRIFEDVRESMINMHSEEPLFKGVSVEQVRKIVNLIHQKINAALSKYIKQQIFCQGPTWLELPSTSTDGPGQLLATASINLFDTRWQASADSLGLSLTNFATETRTVLDETDSDVVPSIVKVALKILESFVDSSHKANKEVSQRESSAHSNTFFHQMSEKMKHFSKRDQKTVNQENIVQRNQSHTTVDATFEESSNEGDEKAESSGMVETVPKDLESPCDSLESGFGIFDNSLPQTPRNSFTAESQLPQDNFQERLESAISNIFKNVEDKLNIFSATKARATITPEKQQSKSPAFAVDEDM